ncbi:MULTISPECIES: DUF418 domain-containing protein [unclassified Carboxylicivirga]|uniref:DUF418 domain-containing protein n=1 Tax=Carboxylicivirga TaxID=1628153 RepID=UPI003D32DC98
MKTNNLTTSYTTERILSIDMLRGVAVLGILILNIQSFSMIFTAYINPTAYGDLNGLNLWVWILSHILASEKFLSIFSLLFGAGIILMYERRKQEGKAPGLLQYYRLFWLFIFGMLHAYLIWYGDILVTYSLCGAFVYLFRKMKPRGLLILASFLFILPALFNIFSGATMSYWPEAQLEGTREFWQPNKENIDWELQAMRGRFSEQMQVRGQHALMMQTFLFFSSFFWRISALMLLGMALFKTGVLQACKSKAYYIRMAAIGLIGGYGLSTYGVWELITRQWSFEYALFFGYLPNYFASVMVALGYVALIMLVTQSRSFTSFKRTLSAVGRMAFSNYILMSLIASLLFYGHGLALFGKVTRLQQMLITLIIWALILFISPLWLKHFRYGPLEWLWRCLSYHKKLPFKR